MPTTYRADFLRLVDQLDSDTEHTIQKLDRDYIPYRLDANQHLRRWIDDHALARRTWTWPWYFDWPNTQQTYVMMGWLLHGDR